MDKFAALLSRGGLSYDRLINFCRIAEAGSLTKAADGDPGRQSLYSRQIRELEEFFGVELKRREGKGIAITDAGRQLAQLARAHLIGLEDFQREAKRMPKQLSIAAGNSIVEWVLLPKIAELRAALPDTNLQFFSERTSTIIDRLLDMTLDIGLVREDAVVPPLKSKRLFSVGHSLFVPRKFSRGLTAENLKSRIKDIPLATSVGGQFRETLETAAAKVKWDLHIAVSCSSFTQAARAVEANACGAVLPDFAARYFDPTKVSQLPLPFLRDRKRTVCLAWNPRLSEVRFAISSGIDAVEGSITEPEVE